ncbi:MAG TPA: DUF4290 domain-containing protein [Ferruginibacter sp.]|jgi:hypothetical protein|nr:DUF4290 domain-containing protein [Chitinophagaceae bacterium]HML56857.1 DUF4290 domain-containing protein [Ferruginibacter sp.]HRN91327.1 DUF4290 domain-containing protein [Ferruginibacter sp.]HRO05507.1 DUF4290 domain-containing protein [Ferruginibacter sp.]HRO96223.1 DUF4290 domain-containing protein [Ferruginibacter sp.]
MEYNTTRNKLEMKEYGRHIQKMVEHLLKIEDREVRQKNAYAVIELMGFLNPHLKNVEDFRHKLWDHLFLISDFKLDVDSPYPIPTRETLRAKPDRLHYPKRYPKFNHLGKNIEIVIDKALQEENPEKKQGFANAIAYYMKLTYSNWHKELVQDETIQSELSTITKGELEFTNRPFVKHRADNRSDMDDYASRGAYRKNYGARDGRQGQQGRDNRGGQRRDGGGRDRNMGGNRNFKKRY